MAHIQLEEKFEDYVGVERGFSVNKSILLSITMSLKLPEARKFADQPIAFYDAENWKNEGLYWVYTHVYVSWVVTRRHTYMYSVQ